MNEEPEIHGSEEQAASPLWPFFAFFGFVLKLAFILAFAALLAGAVGYGSYVYVTSRIHGEKAEVPVLVGEDVDDALQALSAQGLTLELIHREYGAQAPAGIIIDQRPQPETVVKKGTPVRVVVSGGPVNVPVPVLVGQSLNAGRTELERLDLKPGEISSIEDVQAPVGTILATEPASGQPVVRGARVNLLVSMGPPALEVSMPMLRGKTPGEAEDLFRVLGLDLKITEIQSEERADVAPGVIFEQIPPAGKRVSPEAAVMIKIARAPEMAAQ